LVGGRGKGGGVQQSLLEKKKRGDMMFLLSSHVKRGRKTEGKKKM